MTLSLTDINVGTTADDGTGDTARVAGQTINTNNGLIETEVNAFYTSLDTGQIYCDNLEIQNGGQVAAQTAASGLVFSGGPDAPAELRCYDTGHATLAQDWLLVSNSALTLHYDHSAAQIDSYKDFHINSGSVLEVDTISETTSANGVVVDSVTLKDGGVQGAGGILLTERADHQNTPGATKGEFWVKSDTPCSPMFTDDAGNDYNLLKPTESLIVALGDETTALTTGIKVTMYAPYAMTLTGIKASVVTAPTDATLITDVHLNGTTIMTTNKLQIETGEFHTKDATTPPALTTTAIAEDDKLEFEVDQIGSTVAGAGLKVYLIGYRT